MRQRLAVHVRLPGGTEYHLATDVPLLELVRCHIAIDARERGLVVEPRLRIVEVRHDRLVGDVAARRIYAHRADQHQLAIRGGRLAGPLGRAPSAESQPNQGSVAQPELAQQPAMNSCDIAY